MWRAFEFIVMYWKMEFVFLYPIVTLPIFLLNDTSECRCMYCFSIMSAFWITEALPAPVTSILPMVMFPLMGIMNSDEVAINYMNDTNMMLIGSVAIAVAMENSGLHIRIALHVIKCIGCSIKKLHVGICFVTMFVSMWIANTAATALMIPIVEGTLEALQKEGIIKIWREEPGKPEDEWRPTNITMCYYISIAYCSGTGGSGCLIGSGANLAYKGIYETRFPGGPGIEFAKWMMFNVPLMLLVTCLIILWLQILYFGTFRPFSQASKNMATGSEAKEATKAVINQKIAELGPLTFKEFSVGICFLLAICFWFFRRPGFMQGWPDYITKSKCKDAVVAITVFVLFFLIPMEPNCVYYFSSDEEKRPTEASESLLTWKNFSSKMHWGMLFVLGGGFAMAKAAEASGMTVVMAEYLNRYLSKNQLYNLIIFTSTGAFITQFLSSNVACVSILIPIVNEICVTWKIHPIYFTFSTALACTYSFFLPVSTPPNALISGPSRMGAKEMMVSGSITWLICLGALIAIFPVYSPLIWDYKFPAWALINGTTPVPKI